MSTDTTVGSLMMFTLIAVLAILLIAVVHFLRKRKNRHPMEGVQERNIDEIRAGEPPRR